MDNELPLGGSLDGCNERWTCTHTCLNDHDIPFKNIVASIFLRKL